MQHPLVTGLLATILAPNASAFFPGGRDTGASTSAAKRTAARRPLHARKESAPPSRTPTTAATNVRRDRKKKKNKYADFSKADRLSADPLDAMIDESRAKLRELHGGDAAPDPPTSEQRERNKRTFPDTKSIDPYDPTTYGYIELGTIIGAHGVRGLMKLTSTTDFSQQRLCTPGTRHVKPPNRRSPREVQLLEGRPFRSDSSTAGSDAKPIYLIRLGNVADREEALKMRGCILYSLEEETVHEFLAQDEYIVSDLIGLNVFLDETSHDNIGAGLEDSFVGNIRGVVMGSEMCAVPGLGQDLLEVVLPSPHGGRGEDLVLIPFVPDIVSRVNLDGRMVFVDPPAGLLDLTYRREKKVRIKGLLPPAKT